MNKLIVEVYSTGTTRIVDPRGELPWAQEISYSTGYPGGLYLTGNLYIPRDILNWWAVAGGQRVVIRNGLTMVFEGYIDTLESLIDGAAQGVYIPLTGAWDTILQRRLWDKRWSDNRVSDEIWRYQTDTATYTGAEKCTVDRQTRIRFTPKGVAWADGEFAAVRYTMSVGQTIKRITYTGTLDEGGQAWELGAYRSTDASSWTAMTGASGETYATGTTTVGTADGTQAIDVTLATPSRYLELRFYSRAAQTPTEDGAIFAQFASVVVYSETSAINITEVATDIVGAFTTLNSDTSQIDSLTQTLTPFVADDAYLAEILSMAAEAGDGSGGKVAFGLLGSESAATPDGKPVLYVEAYPVLTDYDYAIRLDDQNLVPPVSIVRDYSRIANDIAVSYADENGYTVKITSTDQATLTDSTSVAAYGTRQYALELGYSTAAVALVNGVRYLAAYKEPQYIVTAPITVVGYIRAKNGNLVPSSEIRAGKRLKIENYNPELILLITGTTYEDTGETCSMSFGYNPEPWLDMLTAPARAPIDNVPGAGGAGGGGGSNESLNWKRKIGLKPGSPEWIAASKMSWAEKKALIAQWRAGRRGGKKGIKNVRT